MLQLRTGLLVFCVSLPCAGTAAAPAADQHPPLRVAAAEVACAGEVKSSNSLELAQTRIRAAEADLNLSRGGRCRSEALRTEQYAYQALEDLEKQAGSERDAGKRAAQLQVIHEAMADLRSAEQSVQQSEKTDPQGKVGVDVTALDNAMHTLEGYSTAASTAPALGEIGGSSKASGTGCEPLSGSQGSDAEKVMARLSAAHDDLEVRYRGRCRQAALDLLVGAGRDLEMMQDAEVKTPSFPGDKTKEKRRLEALDRARKYQIEAATTVKDALSKDPQGNQGVNVAPINNALAALKQSYGS